MKSYPLLKTNAMTMILKKQLKYAQLAFICRKHSILQDTYYVYILGGITNNLNLGLV